MKLQLERDIFREMDRLIDDHVRKGGRNIRRIDLDDHEWVLFHEDWAFKKDAEPELFRINHYPQESAYFYRNIEIVKR